MTKIFSKLQIHLWIYNHPLTGISDQIEFFFMVLQQQGYALSVSRRPRLDALNVVIENFSDSTSRELMDFCERTGKRVAVIMTEHLDLREGELYFHGERFGTSSDYMHPATQMARVKNLMDCITCIRSLFVLGDLPQLLGAEVMFPGLACRYLPFPRLLRPAGMPAAAYDLAFTGALTAFRQDMLDQLQRRFKVEYPDHFLSRHERDAFNQRARLVLNVPQRPGWKWLSLMRVMAALRCGRATVSIETADTSCISRCCLQLPRTEFDARIGDLVANADALYNEMATGYETMRQKFLAEHPFPGDLFAYWALLESKHLGPQPQIDSLPADLSSDENLSIAT